MPQPEEISEQKETTKGGNKLIYSILLVALPAISSVVTVYIKSNDCQHEKLESKAQIDSLILTQNFKDQQCQKTLRSVLKSQEALLTSYLTGLENKVKKMQPDTVMVQPKESLLSPVMAMSDTGSLGRKKGIKRKDKECDTCPVAKVVPNKTKAILLKEIDKIKTAMKLE